MFADTVVVDGGKDSAAGATVAVGEELPALAASCGGITALCRVEGDPNPAAPTCAGGGDVRNARCGFNPCPATGGAERWPGLLANSTPSPGLAERFLWKV